MSVHIAIELPRTRANIGSLHRPLQQTPEVFDVIRVNVTFDVFLAMVDYEMAVIRELPVSLPFVGINGRIICNIPLDLRMKRLALRVFNNECANTSASFCAMVRARNAGRSVIGGTTRI